MKKTLLLPLVLGLLLVGCSRTASTKTKSTSASNLPSADSVAAASTPPAATNTLPADTTPPPTVSVNIPPPASRTEAETAPASPPTTAKSESTPATTTTAAIASETTPAASATASTPATPEEVSPVATASPDAQASTGSVTLAARIAEWNLTPDRISEEITQSDHIERTKAIEAGAPTGAMETGVITDQISGKFQADTEISSQKFGIMVLGDVATVTGSARTPDQIGRAMALALDTDGVSRVISKIKLEPTTAP